MTHPVTFSSIVPQQKDTDTPVRLANGKPYDFLLTKKCLPFPQQTQQLVITIFQTPNIHEHPPLKVIYELFHSLFTKPPQTPPHAVSLLEQLALLHSPLSIHVGLIMAHFPQIYPVSLALFLHQPFCKDFAQQLVSLGADVNMKLEGTSLSHLACMYQHNALYAFLINHPDHLASSIQESRVCACPKLTQILHQAFQAIQKTHHPQQLFIHFLHTQNEPASYLLFHSHTQQKNLYAYATPQLTQALIDYAPATLLRLWIIHCPKNQRQRLLFDSTSPESLASHLQHTACPKTLLTLLNLSPYSAQKSLVHQRVTYKTLCHILAQPQAFEYESIVYYLHEIDGGTQSVVEACQFLVQQAFENILERHVLYAFFTLFPSTMFLECLNHLLPSIHRHYPIDFSILFAPFTYIQTLSQWRTLKEILVPYRSLCSKIFEEDYEEVPAPVFIMLCHLCFQHMHDNNLTEDVCHDPYAFAPELELLALDCIHTQQKSLLLDYLIELEPLEDLMEESLLPLDLLTDVMALSRFEENATELTQAYLDIADQECNLNGHQANLLGGLLHCNTLHNAKEDIETQQAIELVITEFLHQLPPIATAYFAHAHYSSFSPFFSWLTDVQQKIFYLALAPNNRPHFLAHTRVYSLFPYYLNTLDESEIEKYLPLFLKTSSPPTPQHSIYLNFIEPLLDHRTRDCDSLSQKMQHLIQREREKISHAQKMIQQAPPTSHAVDELTQETLEEDYIVINNHVYNRSTFRQLCTKDENDQVQFLCPFTRTPQTTYIDPRADTQIFSIRKLIVK